MIPWLVSKVCLHGDLVADLSLIMRRSALSEVCGTNEGYQHRASMHMPRGYEAGVKDQKNGRHTSRILWVLRIMFFERGPHAEVSAQ